MFVATVALHISFLIMSGLLFIKEKNCNPAYKY
jgi:hypothetical protein